MKRLFVFLILVISFSLMGQISYISNYAVGPVLDVAVDSVRNVLFVSSGGTVFIISGTPDTEMDTISIIRTPHLVGVVKYDCSDSMLYIGYGASGLEGYDVKDLTNPVLVASNYDVACNDLDIYGNYAYVIDNSNLLCVLDLSQDNYTLLSSLSGSSWGSRSVCTDGNYAYVAGYNNGFVIVDVSNPDSIYEVSSINDIGRAYDVCFASLYVACASDSGLVMIDVTDPSSPVEKGVYKVSQTPYYITAGDTIIYISHGADSIDAVSLTTLSRLGYYYSDYVGKLNLWGEILLVCENEEGLNFLKSTYSPQMGSIGKWGGWMSGSNIAYYDSNIFVADLYRGIDVIGVYDSASTYGLSRVELENVRDVAVDGINLFAITTDYGVYSYDISDISAPAILGSLEIDDICVGVDLDKSLLCVATRDTGLFIVDVSDPFSMSVLSYITISEGYKNSLFIDSVYVYVGSDSSLSVVNIEDPANPSLVADIPINGRVNDIWVKDGYAYLSLNTDTMGWVVCDLSDYSVSGYYDSGLEDYAIYVSGDYLFTYEKTDNKLKVYDVSSPQSPVLCDSISTPFYVYDIKGNGNIIYTTGYERHLDIYWFPIDTTFENNKRKIIPISRVYKANSILRDIYSDVEIYDITGKIVRKYRRGEKYILDLPAGVYILKSKDNQIGVKIAVIK